MRRPGNLIDGDARVREHPPRWKSAVATFLGVLPTALVLGKLLSPWIAAWPFVLRVATFNAAVVAGAYWIVMPLVLRALRGWLTTKASRRSPSRTP